LQGLNEQDIDRADRFDGCTIAHTEVKEAMAELKGFQKKYLRGLAHELNPIVMIGKEGLESGVVKSVSDGLFNHELIKVRFISFKEKEQKETIAAELAVQTESEIVGMIGHTLILYRQQPDPKRRRIRTPAREHAEETGG
jgi:RNA-binding protein